jgi:molybdate transport system ATP-binding protein
MAALEIDASLALGDFRLAVRETIELAGITAVFGASGSGKTTLLRVIAGLEPEARGSIRFRGTAWLDEKRSLPPEDRALGVVFQDGRLFPHLDVTGNLMFPVRHGRRHGAIGFDDTVQALGLEALLQRHISSLSGGERQRVAIGRALLSGADLLLMDEPLSSLDRDRKREILPLIRSLPDRFGLPILYVTHDVDELIYLASHVLLQEHGGIVRRGGPREIFQGSEFAIIETEVTGHSESLTFASFGDGELRVPRVQAGHGDLLRLRIDPRDVILATAAPTGISIRNCLAATVQRIDSRDDGLVDVRLGIGEQWLTARITADAAADLGLAPGQQIYALIKTVALNAL